MIPVHLNPDQSAAVRAGSDVVALTEAQALSVRGRLTGMARRSPRVPQCACGCGLSLAVAMKRHPKRARGTEAA